MRMQVPLLGMPAGDEWALYGPEPDRTLGMRNVLTYDIFRRTGRWAPRTRFFEVRRLLLHANEMLRPLHVPRSCGRLPMYTHQQ